MFNYIDVIVPVCNGFGGFDVLHWYWYFIGIFILFFIGNRPIKSLCHGGGSLAINIIHSCLKPCSNTFSKEGHNISCCSSCLSLILLQFHLTHTQLRGGILVGLQSSQAGSTTGPPLVPDPSAAPHSHGRTRSDCWPEGMELTQSLKETSR